MPCIDGAPSYDYLTQEKLNKVTRLLCEVCATLDTTRMSAELKEWWRKHQEADRIRHEKEEKALRKSELRKELLSKMTDEEKEALNL